MAGPIQCDNCGALLTAEDVFCGECGAPQPPPGSTSEQPEGVAAPDPILIPPSPEPLDPESAPSSAKTGWRVAVIVLLTMGFILCLAGVIAFLIFGLMEGEDTTPAEDWLFSAVCCLLPIGGTGAVLATVGAVLWSLRLRER